MNKKILFIVIGVFVILISFVSAHIENGGSASIFGNLLSGSYGNVGTFFGWLYLFLIVVVLILIIFWLTRQVENI